MKKYNLIFTILLIIAMLCGCSTSAPAVDSNDKIVYNKPDSNDEIVYNKPDTGLAVQYIDVGQGDSILITTPDNKNMLIDAGEGKSESGAVLNYLNSKNITNLDVAVATHPHSDHINAMDSVIKAIPISHFYMPNAVHTTQDFENMLNALEAVPDVIEAKSGMQFTVGDFVNCEILAPIDDSYDDLNNYSVVIRLTYGDTAFLFTGDSEALVENQILASGANVKANVLKCGHHGSSTSTSAEYLDAISPQYAVISCGADNSYGHPHRETMQALNNRSINVLRTDQMGTIIIESDGKTVTPITTADLVDTNTTTASEPIISEPVTAEPVKPEPVISDPVTSYEEIYIGNINTQKFHKQSCRTLPKPANQVIFNSKQEAEDSGYTPCGNCNP